MIHVLLLCLAAQTSEVTALEAALEATALAHTAAARRHITGERALLADAGFEALLAQPLDDATHWKFASAHGDLLSRLEPRRALARFQEALQFAPYPQAADNARDDLLTTARAMAPMHLVEPHTNRIDFGFYRPHGARNVFCCIQPEVLTDDEERAVAAMLSVGERGVWPAALVLAAHGSPRAIPLLRAMRERGVGRNAILSGLPLIDLLWVRGDPTLQEELTRVGTWATAENESATQTQVRRLTRLLEQTPPEIVRGTDTAATAARWLLLLSENVDHDVRAEVERLQRDAALRRAPAVVWALGHLRQPLPPPLGPDLGGFVNARPWWRPGEELSADDRYAIYSALSQAGDALERCWRTELEASPALRVETNARVDVTARVVADVVRDVVVSGSFPAPSLTACLKSALDGKRLPRGPEAQPLANASVSAQFSVSLRLLGDRQ
jgi:hypothetical protein